MMSAGSLVVNSQKAGNAQRHLKRATRRYVGRRPNLSNRKPIRGIVTTASAAAMVRPMVPTDLSTSSTLVR
ncbi:hypothetical protein BZM27_51960 [Paraburkholderia steynii]|uniref:Uncharacterized protein n=1 Tax=Paraburkholderia steynii TaxID=1245441 RepID=A0A4R0WZ35_9BURK|nr:hypothetical protein BZM27_51960 [Paraburkholderia steynii]